ncbi:MAG: hypothetical protein V2I41_08615 [Pseudomonadales bacterium]|nr:hypothetical protein [Pseudomonadales bacterium]
MNTDTKRSNTPTLPKYLAAAGITLLLMAPLTASADHDRHDVVEVLAGAAVAYLIIDALDDDSRYHRRHRDHYAHDRHYKQRHHDRHYQRHHHDRYYKGRHHAKHKRHYAKHKRHHRQHKRHGYKDSYYRRYYR